LMLIDVHILLSLALNNCHRVPIDIRTRSCYTIGSRGHRALHLPLSPTAPPFRDRVHVRSVWTAQRGVSAGPKGGHHETRRADDYHVGDGVGVPGHMWLCVKSFGVDAADRDLDRLWPASRILAVGASAQDEHTARRFDAIDHTKTIAQEMATTSLGLFCLA
jgi:hypothetical protein